MKCVEVAPELVAYQFNALDDVTRSEVETHLVECAACVRKFISLKRAVESSEDAPGLFDAARSRLRQAVAEARWSWWERPLALAVSRLCKKCPAASVCSPPSPWYDDIMTNGSGSHMSATEPPMPRSCAIVVVLGALI
jgi:hypothetical protein